MRLYLKLSFLAAGVLFAAIGGCTLSSIGKSSPFVFPASRFVAEGASRPMEDVMTQMGAGDEEELRVLAEEILLKFGADAEEEWMNPFFREHLPYVTFESFRPGREIADFYEQEFRDFGWKEIRGILLMEQTNCGGDWLRVFAKEDARVLVHVCGPMEPGEWESSRNRRSRYVTLRFRGITPEEFLGTHFRLK